MTITAGRIYCQGGKTVPAWGDPGYWLPTPVAPRTAIGDLKITDVTNSVEFGMDIDASGNITGYAVRVGADTIKPVRNGTVGPTLFVPADNTEYSFYISVANGKAYWYAKGGTLTSPTLLWLDTAFSFYGARLGIANFDAAWQADNVRMALATLPATVLSAVQTAPTPALTGSELLTNPGYEGSYTAGVAPNWTMTGSGTAAEETTNIHGGTSAQKLTRVANSDRITAGVTAVIGKWYKATMWLYSAQAGASNVRLISGSNANNSTNGEARLLVASAYTQVPLTWLATTTTPFVGMWLSAAGTIAIADDASVKELTLSTLMSVEDLSVADIMVEADLTLPIGVQGGLVLNVDSASSPANLVLVVPDLTLGNVLVRKLVAGTWTTVSTTAITYVAGATLRVWRSGSSYRVYYNKLLVTTANVADGGILSNTKHGRFATDASVTIANYAAYNIGTANEYATLDTIV